MDDVLYELKYTILAMLDKNVQKGDISPSEMSSVKEAVCTLHYIEEIDEIKERRRSWEENSERGNNYERRRSSTTGRYMSGRSYDGHSYDSNKDGAIMALEKALSGVKSERERQAIMDSMEVLNRN